MILPNTKKLVFLLSIFSLKIFCKDPVIYLEGSILIGGVSPGSIQNLSWSQTESDYVHIDLVDNDKNIVYILGVFNSKEANKLRFVFPDVPFGNNYRYLVWIDKRPENISEAGEGVSNVFSVFQKSSVPDKEPEVPINIYEHFYYYPEEHHCFPEEHCCHYGEQNCCFQEQTPPCTNSIKIEHPNGETYSKRQEMIITWSYQETGYQYAEINIILMRKNGEKLERVYELGKIESSQKYFKWTPESSLNSSDLFCIYVGMSGKPYETFTTACQSNNDGAVSNFFSLS